MAVGRAGRRGFRCGGPWVAKLSLASWLVGPTFTRRVGGANAGTAGQGPDTDTVQARYLDVLLSLLTALLSVLRGHPASIFQEAPRAVVSNKLTQTLIA